MRYEKMGRGKIRKKVGVLLIKRNKEPNNQLNERTLNGKGNNTTTINSKEIDVNTL